MEHRQEMVKAAQDLAAENARVQRVVDLQEGRDFQEHKREVKADDHRQDVQQRTSDYYETKDHSTWHVNYQNEVLAERQRPVVEELLENHQFIREYKQAQ